MERVEEAHKNATPEQREQMKRALSPIGQPEERNRAISKEEVEELVANPLQNMLPAMVRAMVPSLCKSLGS
jgi:hypothetical protein